MCGRTPVMSTWSPSCSSEQPASHSQTPQRGEGQAIGRGPGSPPSHLFFWLFCFFFAIAYVQLCARLPAWQLGQKLSPSVFHPLQGAKQAHQSTCKLLPIVLVVAAWGRLWRGHLVLCHCNNTAVVTQVNRLHAHDPQASHMLRCLAFLKALHD